MPVLNRRLALGRFSWLVRELTPPEPSPASPVVFVPGLGSGDYLLPHACRLAQSRTVLVPDLPGFGTSRGPQRLRTIEEFADSLLELIHSVADQPVDVVGNSFGTQVAVSAAAQRPAAIRRLILIGPTFDRAARTYPRMFLRWLTVMPIEPPALGVSLLRSYAKSGIRTPAVAFRAGMRDEPERKLAVVNHPVLLVRGTRDRIAPRSWLDELQRYAGAAEIAELPGVAHTVDFAAPEQLTEITREFLDRPEAPAASLS